jgi:hypothetical protein
VLRRWSLPCCAALSAVMVFAAQAAAATPEWSVVPTPRAHDVTDAVSCTSSTACVAVGSLTTLQGSTQTLAEQLFEGPGKEPEGEEEEEWRVLDTPSLSGTRSSSLLGVSCAAATACIAVGRSVETTGAVSALAELWNGTSWSLSSTPDPAGSRDARLNEVSCTAEDACTAVGSYTHKGATLGLVERWNGTEWTIQESPNPSESKQAQLLGVSCISPSACTAVGSYMTGSGAQALAESWDGTTWSLRPAPAPAGAVSAQLLSVSCTAASACTAVGAYNTSDTALALAERWNGNEWSIQSTPDRGTKNVLDGVSCTGFRACTAVGHATEGTLAEEWNGSEWIMRETPSPTARSRLLAVACISATSCKAAGEDGQGVSLDESLNGSAWSIVRTEHAVEHTVSVSCTSPVACTAVGWGYPLSPYDGTMVAEQWNGVRWSAQQVPSPPGTEGSGLYSVSCTAADSCTAVGSYKVIGKAPPQTLAEHWNGAEWAIQETSDPIGTADVGFAAVSCTAEDACTAVGTNSSIFGTQSTAFIERWNGSEWSIQESPSPTEPPEVQFKSVSCATSSSCIAVGLGVAEGWNGTTWSLQKVPLPLPPFGRDGGLFGVSCSAPSACTAVGQYDTGSFSKTLIERWNGSSWSPQSTPETPEEDAVDNRLEGVSCAASNACAAVGFGSHALAEGWNGTEWLIQSTARPQGPSRGVSCTAPTFCMSVGSNGENLLAETYTAP